MSSMSRVSLTIPAKVVSDLKYIAKRLGVSRSSLVADLLSEPSSDLRRLLEGLPDAPTASDVVRFRGASVDIVHQRLESLKRLENDLFSE